MRLQKQKTREVKGKEYYRWSIVIPPGDVAALGWKEGDELRLKRGAKKLTIRKSAGSPHS